LKSFKGLIYKPFISQENSWDLREELTSRGLIDAICSLTWKSETSHWDTELLTKLLPLLPLPNVKLFPKLWMQASEFIARTRIEGTVNYTIFLVHETYAYQISSFYMSIINQLLEQNFSNLISDQKEELWGVMYQLNLTTTIEQKNPE